MALVLTDSGEKLEITAGVVIPFTVHYADYVGATPVFTPGVAAGDTINGTKDLLVAPGSGQRVVRTITVHNDSGGVDTITVQLDDGGTNYTIITVILPDDYTLCYDEDGWCVLDSDGAVGTTLFAHAILGPHHSDAATDAVSQGSLIYGNATPAFDELIHPGAINRVLQSSAAEVVWSANAVTFPTAGAVPVGSGANTQIAYWTAANILTGDAGLTYNAATDSLTIGGDILMADDHFVGITGDIRIEFDQTDGDIMLHLGDAAGGDEVQVLDSGSNVMAYIDSDGNANFEGHTAAGSGALVIGNYISNYQEVSALNAGSFRALNIVVELAPTANYTTTAYGLVNSVFLTTAQARTGGSLVASMNALQINNGVAATNAVLRCAQFTTDVEDATAILAQGIWCITPAVDTGSCTTGYGIQISKGTLGAVAGGNRIGTLYGLRIDDMEDAKAGTSYAIYCAGSNSYHAGKVAIGGTVAPLAQLHVDQPSASAAIPVLYLDQGDVSEPFTNYVGTSAASAANSLSSWTTGNAVQGHIQIDVNGVKRWLRFYDDPTS